MQTCKQCGEIKPLDNFRKYYGGRKGYYKICKQCERINSRCKYLEHKLSDSITAEETEELNKIYALYEAQVAYGFQPPRYSKTTPVSESVDSMLSKYEVAAHVTDSQRVGAIVPVELTKWLTHELTEDPDYYLENIYTALKDTYMPVLRVDKVTLLPVYDTTYKDVLSQILDRFYAYEDKYYEED